VLWLLWAVTIEPFEVSRWRGGCGIVYGISMGMCWNRRCFSGNSGEERGAGIELGDEEQCKRRQRGRYLRGSGVERA
jgi:hypothetical protein